MGGGGREEIPGEREGSEGSSASSMGAGEIPEGDEDAEQEMKEDDGTFWKVPLQPECMRFVDSPESDAFHLLLRTLEQSTIIAMDAEWKPLLHGGGVSRQNCTPRVSILQIACRLKRENVKEEDHKKSQTLKKGLEPQLERLEEHKNAATAGDEEMIFLLDLLALPAVEFGKALKKIFVDPKVLKLGFGFKQDLLHLRGTFPGPECHGCFDKVEPYLEVGKLYRHLNANNSSFMSRGKRIMIAGEYSLSTISEKVLGLPLSKEMQCSNWEQRPLSKRQFDYAAADAHCLLMIFDVLQVQASESWFSPIVAGDDNEDVLWNRSKVGVAGLLALDNGDSSRIADSYAYSGYYQPKRGDAIAMVKAALGEVNFSGVRRNVPDFHFLKTNVTVSKTLGMETLVNRFGEKLLISGIQGVTNNRVKRKTRSRRARETGKKGEIQNEENFDYVGPPPWDEAVGGDGIPRFLCDAMVEGLARQLRCVGIDAASPNSKKCEPRQLVDLAEKERRVILTSDVKLLRRKVVPAELSYRVKRRGKWEQLAEIIETFNLMIREDQLLSRCTKCNGHFIRRPLTALEAVARAPGNQKIPECVLEEVNEFWQCSNCLHLYWQGSIFSRAFEQFVTVCQMQKTVKED